MFCRFEALKLVVHGSGSWKNMQGAMGRYDIALFRHSRTQQGAGTAPAHPSLTGRAVLIPGCIIMA